MMSLVREPEEPNICKYPLTDAQICSISSSKMLIGKGSGTAKHPLPLGSSSTLLVPKMSLQTVRPIREPGAKEVRPRPTPALPLCGVTSLPWPSESLAKYIRNSWTFESTYKAYATSSVTHVKLCHRCHSGRRTRSSPLCPECSQGSKSQRRERWLSCTRSRRILVGGAEPSGICLPLPSLQPLGPNPNANGWGKGNEPTVWFLGSSVWGLTQNLQITKGSPL